MSLFLKIMSYLGWCPTKTVASKFQTRRQADAQPPITKLNRKMRVMFVVLVALVVFFPFPHRYASDEKLVQTLEINTYLSDGESLSEIWNLKGVNIVRLSISSSNKVLVRLIDKSAVTGQKYKGLLAKLGNVHEYDYQATITNVMEVKILNPAWRGDGSAVEISGSVKAYRITKSVCARAWKNAGALRSMEMHINCT